MREQSLSPQLVCNDVNLLLSLQLSSTCRTFFSAALLFTPCRTSKVARVSQVMFAVVGDDVERSCTLSGSRRSRTRYCAFLGPLLRDVVLYDVPVVVLELVAIVMLVLW